MNRSTKSQPSKLILTSTAQALTVLGFGLALTVGIGLATDAANPPTLAASAAVSIPLFASSGVIGLLTTINAVQRDLDLARRRSRTGTLTLTLGLIVLFIGGIL
jgi:hypothetical protein